MAKNDRLFQMIQLLNQRTVVTLETIMNTCQIPERTAYRYLNTISEANIPVFYDRELKGYCLTKRASLKIEDLTSHEAIMLVACLQLITRHLNPQYAEMAALVSRKVTLLQPLLSDDLSRSLGARGNHTPSHADYSPDLSFALVQWAATLKRPITVGVRADDHKTVTDIIIEEPRLVYSNGWAVEDAGSEEQTRIQMSALSYVAVR